MRLVNWIAGFDRFNRPTSHPTEPKQPLGGPIVARSERKLGKLWPASGLAPGAQTSQKSRIILRKTRAEPGQNG
jgi:hypothetical protein